MELDLKRIGLTIKNIRLSRGFTQEQLAEAASISTEHMSRIESGASNFSISTAGRLANSLDVSLDRIVYDLPERKKETVERELSEAISALPRDKIEALYQLVDLIKIINVDNDKK